MVKWDICLPPARVKEIENIIKGRIEKRKRKKKEKIMEAIVDTGCEATIIGEL